MCIYIYIQIAPLVSYCLSDPKWTPPGVAVFVDSDLRFGRASDVPNVGHARVGSTPRMLSQAPAQWDLVPHLRLLETKDLVAVKNVSHKKSSFAYLTVMLLNWSYQPDHSLNILSITSPILSPLMVKSLRLLKPLISSLRSSSQSSLQHADHHMLLSG